MVQKEKLLCREGEQAICSFLEKQHYKIIEKNYRSRWGEIDIIAEHNEILAFIEVKTRRNEYFPIATVVNKTKQQKIIKTAKHFLLSNQIIDKVIRFDIATLIAKQDNYSIEYIPNAFTQRYW